MPIESSGRRAFAWVAALTALAAAGVASAQPAPKLRPDPGVTPYEYTMIESLAGQPERGFRVDYDLISGADHSLVAAIKGVWTDQAGAWTPTAFDPACVTALHGQTGEVARVTLNPLPTDAADMGASFMATCAPDPLFLSMTDILNVALVQVSPKFGADKLRAVGDSAPSDGFQSSIDRPSISVKAASPGGRTALSALTADRATVDWVPDLMQLTLVERNNPAQGPITLAGTEHFAFRLLIDPLTGVLQGASAPYDDLAVVVRMPGLDPQYAPHLAIKRAVTIVRRPSPSDLDRLELIVKLPKDAQPLESYDRYYTAETLNGRDVIRGYLVPGPYGAVGRHIGPSPVTISDGGCSAITILYQRRERLTRRGFP